MKLAVMQPYFLPYIGYFQLMTAADKFVVFDDVHFIKAGWVNRNRMLLNGKEHMFTVPLRGASQNRLICEIEVAEEGNWRSKLLSTIRLAYGKAPFYPQTSRLMERVISFPGVRLDEFLLHSLREVLQFLSLEVDIVPTSRVYANGNLKGQERILDVCKRERADAYINPIGGMELYDRGRFALQGIELYFLKSRPVAYPQGKGEHVPWLSILDVLMFNDKDAVRQLLNERDLVTGELR